ncbi:hypothetical protein DF117_32885 [Burkholderia stagnalis]|uniref:hypothetical protein n=1 Tax=Burkholderia stagnalis TaxID=1503054 RepID=UPI000F5F726D|nr:hypothetical protein [Burkholderia stagnalis]RQY11660.1 hypothetical protein DF117_32885 [Burkholderia stagnalis]
MMLVEPTALPVMIGMKSLALVPNDWPRSDNVLNYRFIVSGDVSNQHAPRFKRIRATSLIKHLVERARINPKLTHARMRQIKQSCLADRT